MPRATKAEKLLAKMILLQHSFSDQHRAALRVVDSFNEFERMNNQQSYDRLSNDVSFLAACALEVKELRG